ncbi:barrier-to-autointegration factor-like [Maniola hyperantus]|uniref:barrier-to-autointegration factor-like n=1 Tax=Aphantopus hyperantus TaxID=2795564 RepID=UPI001567EB22|nr:barrier-to-autointegration factor-like [Maniola hyperantus]
MSTTKKHRDFVAEPMEEKPVTKLAGVGEVLGKRLKNEGYDKAYVVLGQFLLFKKDKDLFEKFMKETCGADSKRSAECYQCLKIWCDNFLS